MGIKKSFISLGICFPVVGLQVGALVERSHEFLGELCSPLDVVAEVLESLVVAYALPPVDGSGGVHAAQGEGTRRRAAQGRGR